MARSVDLFTQYPLIVDPTSKAISLSTNTTTSTSYTHSQTTALNTELTTLNTLHRNLLSLETPGGIPPPPLPINPKRTAQITKLKDTANTAFRKNNHAEAVRLYTFALDMALSRPGWEPVSLARDELAALYANRAQAYMSQREWAEGLVDARASVEAKPMGNAKAWWRGGQCLVEMGRWEEAKAFVGRGIEIEGKESEGGKELVQLMGEVEEGLKRAAQATASSS
ncbi:uncharacterized protein BJX67DRAFT_60689 [Aspergillus lucknowensis]|uniref:Translocation protein sec72 n=1 Tax=Aspergillus lucknowensis TaxID=176173 RepID=A0ABR4LUD6_9EURO